MNLPRPNLYGLMIGIGIYIGISLAETAQDKLKKLNKHYGSYSYDKLIIWMGLGALIGARLYHVIDLWSYYSANLSQIIAVWQGGIGIFGGIIGGILGAVIYLYKQHSKNILQDLLYILDTSVIGLPVAQAIGRLGNFFNQELFGRPTDLPWGIFISPINRPQQYISAEHFHPLFAYEAILNLTLFAILYKVLTKTTSLKHPGKFTGIYMLGYGLIRFVLEYFRINPWSMGVLTTGQLMSFLMVIVGSYLIYKEHNGRY